MNTFLVLLTIFALLMVLDYSKGLTCYDCFYSPGQPGSDPACNNDVPGNAYIVSCSIINSRNLKSILSKQNETIHDAATGYDNKAVGDIFCGKAIGIEGLTGIRRGCYAADEDEDLNGKCRVIDLETGEGKMAAHFCNSINCNTGPVEECSSIASKLAGNGLVVSIILFTGMVKFIV